MRIYALLTLLLLATMSLHATGHKKMISRILTIATCFTQLVHTQVPTNHVQLKMFPLDSSTFFEIKVIDANRELFFGTNQTHGCTVNQNNSCTNHHGGKDCIYVLDLNGQEPVIAELCMWSLD